MTSNNLPSPPGAAKRWVFTLGKAPLQSAAVVPRKPAAKVVVGKRPAAPNVRLSSSAPADSGSMLADTSAQWSPSDAFAEEPEHLPPINEIGRAHV